MKRNYNLLAKKLQPFNVKLKPNQPVVTISEEFGYREYIWIPDMTCRELEQWWKRQRDIDKFTFFGKIKNNGILLEDKSYSKFLETDNQYEYAGYYTCGNSRVFHLFESIKYKM